eukprot:GHVT01063623.1.p1 GENE.GHVT01063623.1~~GHVT01063623.1.p1  ORF type:complete len:114 (+),score=10.10 GHVT01063623.1:1341-1682(+)
MMRHLSRCSAEQVTRTFMRLVREAGVVQRLRERQYRLTNGMKKNARERRRRNGRIEDALARRTWKESFNPNAKPLGQLSAARLQDLAKAIEHNSRMFKTHNPDPVDEQNDPPR